MLPAPLFTLLLLLFTTLPLSQALDPLTYKYDTACDEIINLAKKTATFHNQHQPVLAAKAEAELFAKFDYAVTLRPKQPQAYMSLATFLSNSQRFDESIEMWSTVLPLLPSNRKDLVPMVEASIKQCNYGKLSILRDSVYQHGEGDINQAVELIRQQLDVYYSPRILFDLGTLLTMQSEVNATEYEHADQAFHQSQLSALGAAVTFQAAMNLQKRTTQPSKPCPNKVQWHPVVHIKNQEGKGSKKRAKAKQLGYSQVATTAVKDAVLTKEYQVHYNHHGGRVAEAASTKTVGTAEQMWVNTLTGATLSGPDGVITKQYKCKLHAFATSEWPVVVSVLPLLNLVKCTPTSCTLLNIKTVQQRRHLQNLPSFLI